MALADVLSAIKTLEPESEKEKKAPKFQPDQVTKIMGAVATRKIGADFIAEILNESIPVTAETVEKVDSVMMVLAERANLANKVSDFLKAKAKKYMATTFPQQKHQLSTGTGHIWEQQIRQSNPTINTTRLEEILGPERWEKVTEVKRVYNEDLLNDALEGGLVTAEEIKQAADPGKIVVAFSRKEAK